MSKPGKYLSVTSMVFAILLLLFKLQFDMNVYHAMMDVRSTTGVAPVMLSGVTSGMMVYLVPAFASLLVSIIGFRRKNAYHKISLAFNTLTSIYTTIPVGMWIGMVG